MLAGYRGVCRGSLFVVAGNMEDEENEIQPPPRSLKSNIWKYFGFYREPGLGKQRLDMTHTICRDCNGKVK